MLARKKQVHMQWSDKTKDPAGYNMVPRTGCPITYGSVKRDPLVMGHPVYRD
jgi:hypothetical protein